MGAECLHAEGDLINVPGSVAEGSDLGVLARLACWAPLPAGARWLRKGSMFPGSSWELNPGAVFLLAAGGRNNSPHSHKATQGEVGKLQLETLFYSTLIVVASAAAPHLKTHLDVY